ncbi:hypothetical protein TNCV_3174761 [Trichonephila clavipes]|nr:hypothetical protein TNCV_3174761 [Trichonephila clavipes]
MLLSWRRVEVSRIGYQHKYFSVVVINSSCLRQRQTEAQKIHRGKGPDVRLSLSVALSPVHVTVRFVVVSQWTFLPPAGCPVSDDRKEPGVIRVFGR